jgi:hypothetical protein
VNCRRNPVFSFVAQKAFEFAESFSKLARSNPLLLMDDRCLRVAPSLFLNRPLAISPILKSADEQLSFEKRGAQRPPVEGLHF